MRNRNCDRVTFLSFCKPYFSITGGYVMFHNSHSSLLGFALLLFSLKLPSKKWVHMIRIIIIKIRIEIN